MESEEIVTKILAEREILKKKKFGIFSNPNYDLGDFLKKPHYEPNPYDERFMFIK